MDHETMIARLRAEFLEMPGLQLTIPQAARLCGMDRATCEAIVAALVASSFLRHGAGGRIMRVGT